MIYPFSFLLLPGALFSLSLLLNFAPVAFGAAVNRTIDDTLGDSVTGQRPTFLPSTSGVWEDQTCAGCALQPPTAKAFGGTYTAATYNPGLKNISITFDFTGTAVYIFFILANNPDPGITATTAANFTLDGSLVGSFNHTPNSNASDFQFNGSALAFSKAGLKNSTHQMVISTSGLDDNVWVNFDYALYTFQEAAEISSSSSTSTKNSPEPSASTSTVSRVSSSNSLSSKHLGYIVGGAVGGLAVLGALFGLLFICYRRRRKRNQLRRLDSHVNSDVESGRKDPGHQPRTHLDPYLQPPQPPPLTFGPLSGYRQDDTSRQSSTIPETPRPIGSTTVDSVNDSDPRTDVESMRTPSPQYQYRSVLSTLPSGRIVLAPGTTEDLHAPPLLSATTSEFLSTTVAASLTHNPPSEKSELRRIRQQELERQMREINEEIEELKNEAAERSEFSSNPYSSSDSTSRTGASIRKKPTLRNGRGYTDMEKAESVSELKAQIQQMSEQITLLQSQQDSPWAQGLSDEPPPGYTPRSAVGNGE
ncbi:hypothetical protein F5878DRAFT_708729 [Lentinula raphanica]|uniref:Uncharacterized protein n=1 Tax=Lentinula raphanica TaxID=153919 RepID=A0AA38PCS8_9AGAR|nr:hypothetical protein F5878DRAFT_708729 [Lentinula raphanica]